MAEEGVKGKIHWPLPHHCLQGAHNWHPTICARVQWVTTLEYVFLYILCPLFAGCTELLPEALAKREANPNCTHCLQVRPHLPFPLQQPATRVSPLPSVTLRGKAACGLYLPVHSLWCIPRSQTHKVLTFLSIKNLQLRFKGAWGFTIHNFLSELSFPELQSNFWTQSLLLFSCSLHKWLSSI